MIIAKIIRFYLLKIQQRRNQQASHNRYLFIIASSGPVRSSSLTKNKKRPFPDGEGS